MFTKRKTIRFIAIFLLFNFIFDLALPSISWALTAGPTAPEYTSFEPIDTTDMVNLATGDFTYNIPLVEVPGPEGGYPLSLSYHAGIQPGEEASWVGLGWTLSPGAITRTVNGYPDDHNGAQRIVNDSWEGGDRTTFSVGVGLAGANLSLAFSQDTYQGFGVGASIGYGFGIGPEGSGLSANASVGVGPYGGAFASAGFQAGITTGKSADNANKLGVGVGLSTNFESVSGYSTAGLYSAKGNSMLGVSMSSNSMKPSFSVGGASISQVNSNAGKITTESSGFSGTIPIGPVTVSLGYNYLRYYSNETSEVNTYGAVYPGFYDPDNNSFDSYALLDPDEEGGIAENPEAEKVLGGSMIAFDNYNVTGQGINGNMRPYSFFNGSLFRQNLKKKDSEEYLIQYENKSQPHGGTQFRFINDFSNGSYYSYDFDPLEHFNPDNAPKITSNISEGVGFTLSQAFFKSKGWDYNHQQLAGSKYIQYFTNQQIGDGTAYLNYGFISLHDYNNHQTTIHDYSVADQVGGFMITNESGVTYHYSIPVYAYDEYIKSTTIDNENGEVTNVREHPQPYAYSWLLTAITGPDYVNRNELNDGTIGDNDWGYWVEFDYGMWANNYRWRNPESGWHKDIDENIQTYSRGKKEVYYLDAIKTRTHTALFIKEMREDGKSVSNYGENSSFIPKMEQDIRDFGVTEYNNEYYAFPTASLKLNRIVLLSNDSFKEHDIELLSLKATSTEYSKSFHYSDVYHNGDLVDPNDPIIEVLELDHDIVVHTGENILDIYDLIQVSNVFTSESLRSVNFDYSYDLCLETPNSFSNEGIYEKTPVAVNNQNNGKLTLNSLGFIGKGSSSPVIPPMIFSYEEDIPKTGKCDIANISTKANGQVVINASIDSDTFLKEGDLVKFKTLGIDYYGVIKSMILVDSYYNIAIHVFGNYEPDYLSDQISFQTTKNPPYSKDYTDAWGFYKSDFISGNNNNLSRITTKVSQMSLDSWSLRGIETSLGSNIEVSYKSDQYKSPDLYKVGISRTREIIVTDDQKIGISFFDDKDGIIPIIENEDKMELKLLIRKPFRFVDYCICDNANNPSGNFYEIEKFDLVPLMDNLDESEYLVFDCAELVELLTNNDSYTRDYVETDCYNTAAQLIVPQMRFFGTEYFVSGVLYLNSQNTNYGGGIRVEAVRVRDGSNLNVNSTNYTYIDGSTSFEPFGLELLNFDFGNWKDSEWIAEIDRITSIEAEYKNQVYERISDVLSISRELPSPMVFYQQVKVEEEIQKYGSDPVKAPESRVYEFQVYEEGMNERIPNNCTSCTAIWPGKTVTMRDYSSRLGSLKSVSTYDGENKLIAKQVTNYLHDNIDNETYRQELAVKYANQGFTSELFNEFRIVEKEDDEGNLQDYHMAVMAVKEVYPSIVTGNTTYNYKTGVTTQTQNLAFDFYSGEVTKSLSTDSYGNRYLTEKIPAYKNYTGMGLAMNGGKNMLTQEGATYTYQVSADYESSGDKLGLVGATAQTWSDQLSVSVFPGDETDLDQQTGIWRKKSSYSWRGDDQALQNGLYPLEDEYENQTFFEFSAWNEGNTPHEQWQKNSEVTLVDVYSHALEASDINGQYAATKMDANQERVFATVANARYDEFAYTGAEDDVISDGNNLFWGGVYLDNGVVDNSIAHTGDNSVSVVEGTSNKTFRFDVDNPGESHSYYRGSVWTNSPNGQLAYSLDGGTPVTVSASEAALQSGSWYLINMDIPVASAGTLSVYCQSGSGTVNFDDFRVHPLDAAMTSYVYNEWGELSHTIGANNFYTQYIYDAMGRLKEVWNEVLDDELTVFPDNYEGKIRSSKNVIHYARTAE